jgi:FRG domain
MTLAVKKHFSSLTDCIAYVSGTYFGEVHVEAKDRRSSESLGSVVTPAYLFRGESAQYESTMATIQRLPADPALSERARKLLPKITSLIESQLREFLSLSPMDSAGFAQHYGLPTELLDLTSSTRVAGFFASGGEPRDDGYVAVFPVNALVGSSVTVDLRNHHLAARPRRQQAFALFHREHLDLKDSRCVEDLQSVWFGFTLTGADKESFQRENSILDAHTDPIAGALQLVVDSMVQEHGKLPDEIALWLSRKLAAAPLVGKTVRSGVGGRPEEVELVSATSAAMPFNEIVERERNYRYWSSKYAVADRSSA